MKFSKISANMRTIAMAAGMLVASFSAAEAASITTLFNTGVDAFGNVLANGSADPHYTVSGGTLANNSATFLENPPHPSYLPNSAAGGSGSAWIWHNDLRQRNLQPRDLHLQHDLRPDRLQSSHRHHQRVVGYRQPGHRHPVE